MRLLALAAAVVASTAAAQGAPPAAAAAPSPPTAQAQPAPGGNAKAIEKAKALGKLGVQKVAPKLGKAESLVRKQAAPVVDKAVDLAAEKTGLVAPRK